MSENITLLKYSNTNTYLIEGTKGSILFDTGYSMEKIDKKPLVWGKLYDMGNSISYNRRVDRRVQPFDYNFKLY